jgi:hypothetical protein
MLMRHSQTIVLLAGLAAAIVGIFYAHKEPYSGIAAGAVSIACAIGIVQAYRQAREAAHTKSILSNLARSSPPSPQWKDKVRELVRLSARSHGFVLRTMRFTTSDPDDPNADAICVFGSLNGSSPEVTGVLVITPEDYAELSTLPEQRLTPAIEQLVYGAITSDSSDLLEMGTLENSVVAFYRLAKYGEGGFRVEASFDEASGAITIRAGDMDVTFARDELTKLCATPAILRDLRIAKTVQEREPSLARYNIT